MAREVSAAEDGAFAEAEERAERAAFLRCAPFSALRCASRSLCAARALLSQC